MKVPDRVGYASNNMLIHMPTTVAKSVGSGVSAAFELPAVVLLDAAPLAEVEVDAFEVVLGLDVSDFDVLEVAAELLAPLE